jgi:NADPH2 dehydrogenase
MSPSTSRLFQPLQVGNSTLQHRIGMAPLTRYRASDTHDPTPMMAEYYAQRASVPGTLLVSEGTFIASHHGGYASVPGIWSPEQIAGWRAVTDAVHKNGSFIYCQLWALGRAATPAVVEKEGGFAIRSSSAVAMGEGKAVPKEMTIEEIQQTVAEYATAARNAIEAGFDGVEIHGANGYLIDQFTQDTCNKRTDAYGGSDENRARFALQVAKAVAGAIGAERTGIRFSPWSTFQGMKMASQERVVSQFGYLVSQLKELKLAYLHFVESRIAGNTTVEGSDHETLDFAYNLWDGPFLIAGGYTAETARQLVTEQHPDKDIVVIFGRHFISTPDLPFRVKKGIEFTPYDREKFYNAQSTVGYTDYPFSEQFTAEGARL